MIHLIMNYDYNVSALFLSLSSIILRHLKLFQWTRKREWWIILKMYKKKIIIQPTKNEWRGRWSSYILYILDYLKLAEFSCHTFFFFVLHTKTLYYIYIYFIFFYIYIYIIYISAFNFSFFSPSFFYNSTIFYI